MGAVRVWDPLERDLLNHSKIQQLSADDIRHMTPAVWAQLDRLNARGRQAVHPRGHGRSRCERGAEALFPGSRRAVEPGVGGAVRAHLRAVSEGGRRLDSPTIPPSDPDGLAITALNRMILGAVKGVQAREAARSQSAAAPLENRPSVGAGSNRRTRARRAGSRHRAVEAQRRRDRLRRRRRADGGGPSVSRAARSRAREDPRDRRAAAELSRRTPRDLRVGSRAFAGRRPQPRQSDRRRRRRRHPAPRRSDRIDASRLDARVAQEPLL